MSRIATIPAVPVAAGDAPWKIAETTQQVSLTQDFGGSRKLVYRLPKKFAEISDNAVTVTLGPYGVARWETFRDHVKFSAVFTRKPPVLSFPVPASVQGLTVRPMGGSLELVDGDGNVVAWVLRPWLRDADGNRHDLSWRRTQQGLAVDMPDLEERLWRGAVLDPTTVDTSTVSTATAYSNERKIDRCQNGVLWATFHAGAGVHEFWYSTDNGTTWTHDSTGNINTTSATFTVASSFFIDVDDYAHFAYKHGNDGYIYYQRGTPNAGRTAWTWSGATRVVDETVWAYPDVVAHREGTGWRAHCVQSYVNGAMAITRHTIITIDSAGTIARGTATNIGGDYGSGAHSSVSIDFNHTGDGKTIAGSTPHLYAAWSAGTTGAGFGVRFKKATYASGAWTWGTERAIDSTRYWPNGGAEWLNCLFDGTRVIIAGFLFDGASQDLMLYDRDAADTTTTTRVLVDNAATSVAQYNGSATYDSAGNVYFYGRNFDETSGNYDLVYRKWTRSGASLGAEVVVDATVGVPWVSAKRGYSNSRIEIVYVDGTASPYSVTYDGVVLNTAPTAATWATTAGVKDTTSSLLLDWTFNDPDPSDTQSAYALKRDIGGTIRYWRASDSTWQTAEVKNTSTVTEVSLAAGWGSDSDADHNYYVKTWDAADTEGVYNTALTITPDVKVNPTIDSPADAGTVATSKVTVQWTVAEQSEYRLRLLSSTDVELWTSGWVVSSSARSRTADYELTNSTTYKVELTTKTTEGLTSTADTNTFSTSFTPPPTPTLVVTANSPTGAILVDITNPVPGGTEPAITGNNLYRREVGESGDGTRIKLNIPDDGDYTDFAVASGVAHEYRALALGDNDVNAWSAWTA